MGSLSNVTLEDIFVLFMKQEQLKLNAFARLVNVIKFCQLVIVRLKNTLNFIHCAYCLPFKFYTHIVCLC